MEIIDQLLQPISQHNAMVKRICVGVHWTIVESEVGCGMASTLSQPPPHYEAQVRDAGILGKKSAVDLTEYLRSDMWLEASIGLAALNSLVQVVDSSCSQLNARELIVEKGEGKNIAIIGHFPFVKMVSDRAAKFWVLEKELRDGDTPTSEADKILPQCDVVGISATTIINHTLDDILAHCRHDAFKMLIGPSTPMTSTLFDFGIDALCGCKIINPDSVVTTVSQGATLKQVKGIELLVMQRS